jgi:predicted NUDIX family NTP pyrophosphohydrolase
VISETDFTMKHSAGILLYRRRNAAFEVLLIHPGGPFWAKKDAHAWSMPKGEFVPDDEEPLAAARREFAEETGFDPRGAALDLGMETANGKTIHAWAIESDWDPTALRSNAFTMEWPMHSGKRQAFPEADRAAWFDLETARRKIHKGQVPFLSALETVLASRSARRSP